MGLYSCFCHFEEKNTFSAKYFIGFKATRINLVKQTNNVVILMKNYQKSR